MHATAQLVNRGEQFTVVVNGTRYSGECAWTWDGMTRSYPVYLEAKSIRAENDSRSTALSPSRQLEIANAAKSALERGDPAGTYEVVERGSGGV